MNLLKKLIDIPSAFQMHAQSPFAISADGTKLVFLDETVDRVSVTDPFLKKAIPDLKDLSRKYVLDQRTVEISFKIIKNFKLRKPLLLEGETATSKSSAVMFAAALLGLPVLRINFSKQTDLSELLGKYVPNSSAAQKQLFQIFHTADLASLKPQTREIVEKYRVFDQASGKTYFKALDNESDMHEVAKLEGIELSDKPFVWQEGILPNAMKKGALLLLDEMNLMPPELLAALNPVLEDNPSLFVPQRNEKISKGNGLHQNFFVVGTQNPSAYEGRHKLPSDLLRRFGQPFNVTLPTEEELNEMLSFFIFGIHPAVTVRSQKYQAQQVSAFFPQLAKLKDIGKVLGLIARMHYGVQELLQSQVLGRNRKQKLAVTRRDLFSVLTYLAGDPAFLTHPKKTLLKAINLYYVNRFKIDAEDKVLVDKLYKKIFSEAELKFLTDIDQPVPKTVLPVLNKDTKNQTLEIHDQKLTLRTDLPAADQKLIPNSLEIQSLSLDESTVGYMANLATAINLNQPVLAEGPTATAKTSGILSLAHHLGQPVIRFNLSGQSETSELIGKYVPATQSTASQYQNLLNPHSGMVLSKESEEQIAKARAAGKSLTLSEAKQIAQREGLQVAETDWQWQKGPLLLAMEKGYWIILDELNQADTNILERLNPLLEENASFLVSENGGQSFSKSQGTIHPQFRIFATMNPAEYHGKKTLSPAFINRWPVYLQLSEPTETEISQMLQLLIYGTQPQIKIDETTYSSETIATQYPRLSQLINTEKFLEQLAKFHSALSKQLSPDTRKRKLAVGQPELVLTRSDLKELLGRIEAMEITERSLNPGTLEVVLTQKNILSDMATRRRIILQSLKEVYLDKFSESDHEKVNTLLETHAFTAENWAYDEMLVKLSLRDALKEFTTKFKKESAKYHISKKQPKTAEEAETLLEEADTVIGNIEKLAVEMKKEAQAYNISKNESVLEIENEVKKLMGQAKEIADDLTTQKRILSNTSLEAQADGYNDLLNQIIGSSINNIVNKDPNISKDLSKKLIDHTQKISDKNIDTKKTFQKILEDKMMSDDNYKNKIDAREN